MPTTEIEKFHAPDQKSWRRWLEENHHSKEAVWLVYYKKKTNIPTINYSDAVDEALCFGWIDSTRKSLDEDTFMQFFCKRKSRSGWSKVNKRKVQQLIDQGRMMQAGFERIAIAKQNGSWILLDGVEELEIPTDLEEGFKTRTGSMDFFLSLSKSVRKSLLQWLVLAKRTETRQKRIAKITELAAQKNEP